MGSDLGPRNEEPVHEVTLDAFYIDQYEVTNEWYADCVAAGGCKPPGCTERYGDPDKTNHPVVCVDWYEAMTYCEWRGARLPTEAEWEKAARGTDGRTYPWGEDSPNDQLLNFDQNVGDTTPVGSYPDGVSPYGAYDMAGNVREWVSDWFEWEYYWTAPNQNPQGPDTAEAKVVRDFSWSESGSYTASRDKYYTADRGPTIGFRCAAAAPNTP